MKIGIDARFIGPQGTGLGKYTEKLIQNLQKLDKKNQYSIFLKKSNRDYLKITNKNFSKNLANIPWYSFEEQLKMPKIYKKQNLDLLHIPHFNVPILYDGNFIVTIHDLIHHKFQEQTTTTKIIHYKGAASGMKKVSKHLSKATSESKKKAIAESIRAMELFYKKHYIGRYPFFITFAVLTTIKILGMIRRLST